VKLIVSPDAAADLDRLRSFLADKNPETAQRAAACLVEAIQSLDTFPDRRRLTGIEGVRELIVPFGGSAYVLRYAHMADTAKSSFFASGMAANSATETYQCPPSSTSTPMRAP
jgi:plasmid stabilization system protein ParE